MDKAFEKILKKFKEKKKFYDFFYKKGRNKTDDIVKKATDTFYDEFKKIVQEVAEEYNGGWIPCSDNKNDNLPKDNECVRVTVWHGAEKIGFRQCGKWFVYNSEGLSEATVIAWQPTSPYREKYK